jgi:hypothetical protein
MEGEEEDVATSSMELDHKGHAAGQEKLVNLVSWLTNKIDRNVEDMQAEIVAHMRDTGLRFAEAEARLAETNTILAIKGAKSFHFACSVTLWLPTLLFCGGGTGQRGGDNERFTASTIKIFKICSCTLLAGH